MSELSPAAQAVLDAYRDADIDDEASVAAVLRAAADQAMPKRQVDTRDRLFHGRLLLIADELEAL